MSQLTTFWSSTSNPSANVVATVTRAGVTGFAHICNTIHATFNAGATAPTAAQVSLVVRDGVSGTGPIIWSSQLAVPATAGQASPPISMSGLALTGTAGNAMTLEFTAAGGLNTFETVSMTGFDS